MLLHACSLPARIFFAEGSPLVLSTWRRLHSYCSALPGPQKAKLQGWGLISAAWQQVLKDQPRMGAVMAVIEPGEPKS